MYVAIPLNKQFAFGLGVNAPFGLTTEYDDGWIGRYQALKSSITTVNVNPAMSWKVTPTFAVGAGINYQYIKATLTQNANYSAGCSPTPPARLAPPMVRRPVNAIFAASPGLDSKATITGNDGSWGWNVGARVGRDAGGATGRRLPFGDQVQRERQHQLREPAADADAGHVAADRRHHRRAVRRRQPAVGLYNRGVTSDITLPQIANLSMHWQINPKWELMADAQYTGWSSIPELRFTASAPPALDSGAAELGRHVEDRRRRELPLQRQVEGACRHRLRPDAGHDAPTPRLPDSDRWWFAVGGEYRWTPNWKLDAGFVYIQGDSAEFNQHDGSTSGGVLARSVRTTRA